MKHLALLLFAVARLLSYGNLDTLLPKNNITNVTVFFSGAQVTRKAELKLKKGKCILLIDQLPKEIVPNSIQSTVPSQFKILSVKQVEQQQGSDRKSKEEILLSDQIESIENKIKSILNESSVLDVEERLLIDKSLSDKTAKDFTPAQLKDLADFYRSRLNEIRRNKLNLSIERKKEEEKINKIYEEINALTVNKHKAMNKLYITIDCLKEQPGELKLCYYVSSAGWEPLYDFRVEDIGKPFVIVYNANVFQSSGEEWKNVKLKLSTSNPSLSGEQKKLSAWYIDRQNQVVQTNNSNTLTGAIKGHLADTKTKEPIPFANAVVYQNNQMIATATSNMEGDFYVKPVNPGYCEVKAVYVGYQSAQISGIKVEPGKTAYVSLNMNANNVNLESVEVVAYSVPLIDPDFKSGQTVKREDYQNLATKDINSVAATTAGIYQTDDWGFNMRGGRDNSSSYYVDGVREIETLYFNKTANMPAVTNTEYVIEEPYTIPSDGSDNNIRIKEENPKVTYVYHAIPKLEQEVFLSAEIADWNTLNLISGKSSIYFQDTYVGQSYLDVAHTGDTLRVSLGRDRDVQINRAPNKLAYLKKSNNSNIKEINGTNIVIRNNKNSTIRIIVEDQYPLSDRKSIEIELLESSNAKVNERYGKLNWDLNIEPAEKKLLSYSYSLKYPKWAKVISE